MVDADGPEAPEPQSSVPDAPATHGEPAMALRRRDRFRNRARKYVHLPLWMKTSDLPVRTASAVVMVAVATLQLYLGGPALKAFLWLVAAICFFELLRLVGRAAETLPTKVAGMAAGAAYIALAGLMLTGMNARLLIAVIVAVAFVDIFAYFFGRTIGGPKIAPRISPSKTWAGLLGGVVGATLWLYIASTLFTGRHANPGKIDLSVFFGDTPAVVLPIVGAAIAVLAQAGDFFESWLKRRANMKDSSTLIPGHGGVFDRVDGLLPVSIVAGLLFGSSPW
ncbi:Phosphatidate cytidylyltransferase [Alteripontixanthobacter maritimus]|uniref:Phosphatidate cytidylyltransferase n=1 Tax=Alteripontixanthobacter maritimus TaxID=2161824 RepID=A0A369QDH8_9SPHN|nr:phosphatidate cytidylyltransferase [Alteripontixanthobacter maritimus]RDC60338.1 Phosphatidate cytidylyltransferase [Alteripontixanthobacter maritimus]